jgi:hypothetical protein
VVFVIKWHDEIIHLGHCYVASFHTKRWCRHREEMIYTCTYSEMRILQLIVSGTLANAGRPERVIHKTNNQTGAGNSKHANFNRYNNVSELKTSLVVYRVSHNTWDYKNALGRPHNDNIESWEVSHFEATFQTRGVRLFVCLFVC